MKLHKYSILVLVSMMSLAACKSPSTAKPEAAPAPQQAQGNAEDPNAVVAKFNNGTTITAKQLNDKAQDELAQLEQAYQERKHQIKEQALDKMVNETLIADKAKAAGKTVEEFIKAEVADKIQAPTDAEVKAMYDQAKARNPNMPPMATLKDQIVSFMKQQKQDAAEQAFHTKLKADAGVKIELKPYRPAPVQVEAKGAMKGAADAPITIVAFSDYECPFCSEGENRMAQVMAAYPNKVRLFFRDYPLPIHADAPKASEAAHCAQDQGKYWEMHDKLFANQKALKVADLKGYAKELGLDTAKFDKCLDSGEKAKIVAENVEAGKKLKVGGTPAYFVNGVMISGAQPLEQFKKLIDDLLAQKS